MSLETYAYGDHDLQTVTVARPPYPTSTHVANTETRGSDGGVWVVLIHGGAWRDPTQTSTTYLAPALRLLTTKSTPNALPPSVTGIASISYRLSPHPSYPSLSDPNLVLSSRNDAQHPDHLRDIQSALSFLQDKYGFGNRYILVGHSCGATLAVQAVLPIERLRFAVGFEKEYTEPLAILGMAGIYDLRGLRDRHRDIGAYREIIEGAFGTCQDAWDGVSPGREEGKGEGEDGAGGFDGWEYGRVAVLAHSREDELCDVEQSENMRSFLRGWEEKADKREVHFLSIEGKHDEAWEKGEELARAILFTLDKVQKMGL